MKKSWQNKFIICVLALLLPIVIHAAVAYLKQFDFNDKNALNNWGRMILNGQVDYRLMKHGDNGYVEALSEGACSALYYRIGFKLKDYPYLSWKWRVVKFPDKSKAKKDMEKDDYAARVYVIFPFLNFSSSKFIEYVWDENIPAGTVFDSPKSKNIRQIVARSGAAVGEQWVSESRNVYEDYVMAFGEKPRRNVGAVAIMCNADNTKSEAESLFDDIAIGNQTILTRRPEEK